MCKILQEEIRKAYVEVLEVFKYIPKEEYYKIPKSVIDEMNDNKNIFYKFNFCTDKLSKEAEIMILDLYMTYVADTRKRNLLKDIMELNEKEQQAILRCCNNSEEEHKQV